MINALGFAYPFGLVNDRVIKQLTQTKLIYARKIDVTHRYDVPQDLYRLNPTYHLKIKVCWDLPISLYTHFQMNLNSFDLGILIEPVTEDDWVRFEKFLKRISFKKDI